MKIATNSEGDIFCGGVYDTEGKKEWCNGSYFYKIDKNSKEIVSEQSIEFGEKIRADYNWYNMAIRDDGSVLLSGEYYKEIYNHGNMIGEIIVISVNNNVFANFEF